MIINASAHQIPLADKSVHAVVTSPPYFGLRRYEGAQDVEWPAGAYAPMTGCPPCVEVPAMRCPLGNESTIESFIWHLLLVMRELRRVLRDDGTCWVNLGDSFISAKSRYKNTPQTIHNQDRRGSRNMRGLPEDSTDFYHQGYGDGNLAMVPHRFALAAQADGWTLRNDCVWHKKSAMPESVAGWRFQDGQLRRGSWRHTRAHEYVFQFVKGMGYWSDSEIVKEANSPESLADFARRKTMNNKGTHGGVRADLGRSRDDYMGNGRNPRSVFSPSPSPYSGAHFATFPKELIRPLILSSVPRRCCPECGQGWAAIVQKSETKGRTTLNGQGNGELAKSARFGDAVSNSTSYAPTCQCSRKDYTQGIVLDPFVGSGTTLEVARECGVRAIGLDISHTYLNEQASWRGLQIAKPDFSRMPLFAQMEVA